MKNTDSHNRLEKPRKKRSALPHFPQPRRRSLFPHLQSVALCRFVCTKLLGKVSSRRGALKTNHQPTTSRPTTNEYLNMETKKKGKKASANADVYLRSHKREINLGVSMLARRWSSQGGVRRADHSYVEEGLRRGGLEAEEVEDTLHLMLPSYPPFPDESLWFWFRRVTGEWLGSEVVHT